VKIDHTLFSAQVIHIQMLFTTDSSLNRMTVIIDQTALAGRYDIDFNYTQNDEKSLNLDNMNQALMDQLGLDLVPSRESIKVLVIEKTP